ncbi:fibronectin type III domain-containing protein [Actinoplanes missouriensis]|uniref:fibronectin type III domain-containing protein n=1 Tax=Actinoplanes missouriensis TaxID=1866 RepID=UPI0012F9A192|nr:fibronectin type III domain-containing protein [Actinoplanes missouriensis]
MAGNVRTFTTASTSQSVTGLTASSGYSARVRARDAAGNWSAWSAPVAFSTSGSGLVSPATVTAVASIPAPAVGGVPPTVSNGLARPVIAGQSVLLDVPATPPGGQSISGWSWEVISGAGSLANANTAMPLYTAPAGSGVATVRATVSATHGGSTTATVTVAYGPTIVAAENLLTGTPRATWDLVSPNLGGHPDLQGFCDGLSIDKTETAQFKIGSVSADWSGEIFRLGWYGGDGARSYGTITPTSGQLAASKTQPAPANADPSTTLISADCSGWATTLTWTPPAWAPSGIYILRLARTGGGASHVMCIVRDDARQADLMLMPSDSTWLAYNAWGGLGSGQYGGNSLYTGTLVDQYNSDCARFVSWNRPMVNRGAADAGRSYGQVKWSNLFTAEYPMIRFLERNGHDLKYYGCIDASADPTGLHLRGNGSTHGGVSVAVAVGHNEYWSDKMRSGWEAARDAGVSLFFSSGNDVFWRTVGSVPDSQGRPRVQECQKSTIQGRGSTRPEWTGAWRDPDGTGKGGNAPENTLLGSIFCVNGPNFKSLVAPVAGGYTAQPFWRHTSVAELSSGSWSSPAEVLGFEWNCWGPLGVSTTAANYMAPAHPRARYLSDVTYSVAFGQLLVDAGDVYDQAGTATHRLSVYPGGSGALVFSAGTVNYALALDSANTWQVGSDNTSLVLQQATINMLVDMGAPPSTLMSGLVQPTPVDWYDDVTPGTVQAVASIPTPTVIASSSASRSPSTVAAVAAIPSPTVQVTSSVTRSPATVAAVAAIPAPTVQAGTSATRSPATVGAVTAIPAPAVQATSIATRTPATVIASTAIPTPAVSAGSTTTVSPATVQAAAAIPAPSVRTETVVTLTTVAGVAAIASPTVIGQADRTVSPATVMAVASIPTPLVRTGVFVTPGRYRSGSNRSRLSGGLTHRT